VQSSDDVSASFPTSGTLSAVLVSPGQHVAKGRVLARIQSLYERLPEGERGYVTIRNANHFSFSDQSRLNSQIATWLLRKAVGFGGLEARRGLTITTDLVHTFFDVHLNGADPAAIRDLSAKYPELEPGSSGTR